MKYSNQQTLNHQILLLLIRFGKTWPRNEPHWWVDKASHLTGMNCWSDELVNHYELISCVLTEEINWLLTLAESSPEGWRALPFQQLALPPSPSQTICCYHVLLLKNTLLSPPFAGVKPRPRYKRLITALHIRSFSLISENMRLYTQMYREPFSIHFNS